MEGKRGFTPLKASLKRPARIPIPKTTSISMISPDQRRRKRVKFAGSTCIRQPEEGPYKPSLENKVDGVKTSELKAFKGLLENFVYKHNSDEVATSKINLKAGKQKDCLECLSNAITSEFDVTRSFSPIQSVSHKRGSKKDGKGKIGVTRSVQFSMNTPIARPLHPSPRKIRESYGEHSGPSHEGTFSKKRANLLHLAAMTCSKNVDDFFSNRSDFIIEFLQRLGIRRKSSEHERLQKSKLTATHQMSPSYKKSSNIIEFYENSEENSCALERGQGDNYSISVWDMTKAQAFRYNHAPDTSSKCKLKSNLVLKENGASPLHDFHKSASAIDLRENFNCNKYMYNCIDWTLSKAYALLNSPCEFDEIKARPPDYSAYMGHLNKCLHTSSTSDHKGWYEFCFTNNSDSAVDPKPELDYSRIHEFLQADCIIPNSYNSNIDFQEQALVPYINEFSTGLYVQSPGLHLELTNDQLNSPLLEWDASLEQELPAPEFLAPKELQHFPETQYGTPDNQLNFPLLECDALAEQELTAPNFVVPKEVDHFPVALHDTPDFHNVYGSRGFNCYDGLLENATHQSILVDIIPVSFLTEELT